MTNPRVIYSSRASSADESEIVISNQNRMTILKDELPFDPDWKVLISNCRDTTIYIGGTVESVTITNCKDCELVIMLAVTSINLNACDAVSLKCVTGSLQIEASASCIVHAYTQVPIKFGGNSRDISVAPFNVVWVRHSELLRGVSWIDASTVSMWSTDLDPNICSVVDAANYRLTFFPDFSTKDIDILAVPIPQPYESSVRNKNASLELLRKRILSSSSDTNLHKVNAILAGHFREWLTSSRKIKCIIDLVKQHNP